VQVKTVTGDCRLGFPAWVRIAVAAATPVPVPSALNSVGAAFCTSATPTWLVLPLAIVKVAVPGATPSGSTRLICCGET